MTGSSKLASRQSFLRGVKNGNENLYIYNIKKTSLHVTSPRRASLNLPKISWKNRVWDDRTWRVVRTEHSWAKGHYTPSPRYNTYSLYSFVLALCALREIFFCESIEPLLLLLLCKRIYCIMYVQYDLYDAMSCVCMYNISYIII